MAYLSHYKDGNAAIITINRPPANALSFELIQEIGYLLDQLEPDSEVRAILIHGEGRFFSAGADIKEFTGISSGEEFSKLAENGQEVFEKVENFPKPIIAAIHGAAFGGGLELAMACHIRLVSENAKLGLPELQLGLIPGFAGTQRLPRLVGTAKAAEMLFTSDSLLGSEAVKWGLANHAFPEELLLEKAKEMVRKIAEKSPISLRATIELLQFSKTPQYYEGVRHEAKKFGVVFDSADGKEGIHAFLEKRNPSFTGK
ncbi:enoyl-CoA hydratase [Lederbergia wuyishanensis]|uniref:Enoyl-CoA hydratase n=1 Tax=Lederbergia wuyishanensis TaxID=1347903 RepID=A0ABU0D5C5_9BACI|nr:enoyl-CoA hydratase [Lederbergia wuyishanensis]MCJ8009872.1 enoyl-CoA hydratase [Lederbergia wuyishanensis]MDQ0343591.1 enoyl-CoA hydratase [Lederbergia wuyishanensis]